MILLDTIHKALNIVLDSGVITQLPVTTNWIDIDNSSLEVVDYDEQTTVTLDNSDIVIVPTPGAGIIRQVKEITVSNPNLAAAGVKIVLDNNGTLRIILSVLLYQDESIQYLDGRGVIVLTANGEQKESLLLINLTTQVVGVLPVVNGGTGDATLALHGVLIGNGTSPVNVTTPGTAGQALVSNGASADPTFQSIGTGTVTHTGNLDAHHIVLGNAVADVIELASLGTTTTVLHGNASGDPSFGSIVNADIAAGTIDLTTKVTGSLPATNGGTGLTSLALTSVLTDGATPALNAALVPFFATGVFTLSAAGNRTIAVPSNPTAGQKIIIQHLASGGARTLSLNSGAGGFRFGSDITSLTATASGKTDYIGCIYNAGASFWDVVAVSKGY